MHEELSVFRKHIDQIDQQILDLLEKRMHVVKAIAQTKKDLGTGIVDPAREEAVLASLTQEAKKRNIPAQKVTELWRKMFELSYEIEA